MDVATYTVRQQLPQTRVADLRFSPRATVLATWGPYFGKSPGSPVHRSWSLVVGADGEIVAHTSQFPAISFLFVLQQGDLDFLLDSLVSAVSFFGLGVTFFYNFRCVFGCVCIYLYVYVC